MSGCTGRVFVFCDIQATSRRCSWANSKLSFDDMDGDLGFRMCEDFTGHIACGRLAPARTSILILPRVARGQNSLDQRGLVVHLSVSMDRSRADCTVFLLGSP